MLFFCPKMNVKLAHIFVSIAFILFAPFIFAEKNPLSSMERKLLIKQIPKRAKSAPSGTQIVKKIENLSMPNRDLFVLEQIQKGNIPSFLQELTPIETTLKIGNKTEHITFFVMPDYLAIGSDRDYIRVPMGALTAVRASKSLGFILPTPKMVDLIYSNADIKLAPKPLGARRSMTNYKTIQKHNNIIEAQLDHFHNHTHQLVVGHKKDIVMTTRLVKAKKRVAIYGWHKGEGRPIQPLSTVHDRDYYDYSHGVRLVSQYIIQNGKLTSIDSILKSQKLASALSSEGTLTSYFNQYWSPSGHNGSHARRSSYAKNSVKRKKRPV